MMQRSPLKRKRPRRRAPTELTRCDHWTPHANRNPSRCTKTATVIVSENERYCKGHATEEADRLVGDRVKARDGHACVLYDFNDQPCMGVLSACHLLPKSSYGAIRWLPENIVAGCAGHHRVFDLFIVEKMEWIRNYLGAEHLEAMRLHARMSRRPKPADIIRQYREAPE